MVAAMKLISVIWVFLIVDGVAGRNVASTNANHGDSKRHLQGQTTSKTVDKSGHTVWQSSHFSGCSSNDHSIQIDIDADPTEISDASLIIEAVDVDFVDPNGDCPGGPEVDTVTINGNTLPSYLQGANNAKSVSTFALQQASLVQDANTIIVDTDATNTGCW